MGPVHRNMWLCCLKCVYWWNIGLFSKWIEPSQNSRKTCELYIIYMSSFKYYKTFAYNFRHSGLAMDWWSPRVISTGPDKVVKAHFSDSGWRRWPILIKDRLLRMHSAPTAELQKLSKFFKQNFSILQASRKVVTISVVCFWSKTITGSYNEQLSCLLLF